MNTTTNYNLPQWEDTDVITRGDVNDAMSSIDSAIAGLAAAVAGKVHIETWTYVGEGTYGVSHFMQYSFTANPILIAGIGEESFHIGDDRNLFGIVRDSGGSAYVRKMILTRDGNTVRFASSAAAESQANSKDVVYRVIGLCV